MMYDPWEDEEIFFEPGPQAEAIGTFVEAMKETIKQELKDELDCLRKENTELRELKSNYNTIVQEYRSKERALEFEKSRVLETVRRERLRDLLKDFEVTLYRPDYNFVKGPKCDRCNEDRRIYFKDPLDRETFIACPCGENKTKLFKPRLEVCSSFESRNGKFVAWYKPYRNEDADGFEFYGSSNIPKMIYSGEEFKSIDAEYYNIYFKTEEECQSYCDWLTEKENE